MHLLYKMGNANTEANCHAYYQTLIKNSTANGALSNAYLTSSYVPFKTKCVISHYEIQNRHLIIKNGIVQTLNKSNLPPLPTSRQCPAHSFWVPTHANKEHDHRKTQPSMPHYLEGYQQNRLYRIMRCLHRHRQQRADDHASKISRFLEQLKVELFPNGSSHPASQIKTDLPPAAQILCWLLPSLQKNENNKLRQGGGFFGVVRGN